MTPIEAFYTYWVLSWLMSFWALFFRKKSSIMAEITEVDTFIKLSREEQMITRFPVSFHIIMNYIDILICIIGLFTKEWPFFALLLISFTQIGISMMKKTPEEKYKINNATTVLFLLVIAAAIYKRYYFHQ